MIPFNPRDMLTLSLDAKDPTENQKPYWELLCLWDENPECYPECFQEALTKGSAYWVGTRKMNEDVMIAKYGISLTKDTPEQPVPAKKYKLEDFFEIDAPKKVKKENNQNAKQA